MAEKKSNRGGQLFKDLTGQRFGKLTIIERGPNALPASARWICRCDCGSPTKLIYGTALRFGLTRSCGCNRVAAGHKRIVDITGQKFGRLTVLSQAGSNDEGKALWTCVCDCGNTVTVIGKALRSRTTKSCGCWKRQHTSDRFKKHGMVGTPEYKAWKAAKDRCFNPNNNHYEYYGARGVTMCDEWANSFEAFYAYVGPRPPGTSLDRFPDNTGNYEPNNVRWASDSQQAYNRRPKRWNRRPAH